MGVAHDGRGCCLIVPSRMLRKLAENATAAQRDALIDAALISEHIRGGRSATPLMPASLSPGVKRRTIYDCHHLATLPGTLVRSEGSPPSADATVNQAYDNSGLTYDFYKAILHRNSIDNNGMRLDSSVHYLTNYNNAFWNGVQMVYGDGDGHFFTGFAKALDVVAHELTHGVTQYSVPGGLAYVDQSGALNESISDVFGSVVKQWHLGQTAAAADWLIGAGIMGPAVGHALRSMKTPGNKAVTWSGDDQPSNMSHYVPGGDVHTNSGIPNHAFFLAATAFGGHSWEKAGPIWYAALPHLTSHATFHDASLATQAAALALFGAPAKAIVQHAWAGVGV